MFLLERPIMIGRSLPRPETNWKYVSIDIETLGLDAEFCDIIEFGAVLDDLKTPLAELPRYHCYLTKENNQYRGEAGAMAMHQKILERIANREKGWVYMPSEYLDSDFAAWLRDHNKNDEVVVAGKNFANFDMKFLSKIEFGVRTGLHRRSLDPGPLFYDPTIDDVPPNLAECLKRSGLEKTVSHTAVEDALDVLRCLRYKYLKY